MWSLVGASSSAVGYSGANGEVRSYFGTQQGDFRLELNSISARKMTEDETENACIESEKARADLKEVNEKSK